MIRRFCVLLWKSNSKLTLALGVVVSWTRVVMVCVVGGVVVVDVDEDWPGSQILNRQKFGSIHLKNKSSEYKLINIKNK